MATENDFTVLLDHDLVIYVAEETFCVTVDDDGLTVLVEGVPGPKGDTGPPGSTHWGDLVDKPDTFPPSAHTHPISDVNGLQTALNGKQSLSEKGAANGYAPLDVSAKVPAINLPSYVDDVLEFANLAAFPVTGVAGVIYVALDTNKVYRWGGSSYTEISPSPGTTDAVPEGSTNLYFTNARVTAALDPDLTAIAALASTGFPVRTAANTWAQRLIAGTANRITLSNGDGVAGNPTIDIASTYVGQTSLTTLGTIGTGTWQGTVIGPTYGGFGVNVAAAAGVPLFAAGVPTFVGTIGTNVFVRATGASVTNFTVGGNGTSSQITFGGASTTGYKTGAIFRVDATDVWSNYVTNNADGLGYQLHWDYIIGSTVPSLVLMQGVGIQLPANAYVNFGTTQQSAGYGVRDNAGSMEFKHFGGAWTPFGAGGAGSSQWTTVGSNIYYNTGAILVGTTAPAGLRLGGKAEFANSANYGGAVFSTWSTSNQGPLIDVVASNSNTIGVHAAVADTRLLGGIAFRGSDGTIFNNAASILGFVDGAVAAGKVPGRLVFSTTPLAGGATVDRMVITSAGYVGIGIAAPVTFLDISGANVGGVGQFRLQAPDFVQMSFYDSASPTPSNPNRKAYFVYDIAAGTFAIGTTGSMSYTGTSHFFGSGNVGIGTPTPGNKLEVKGGTGGSDATVDGVVLSTTNTTYITKARIASNYDIGYFTQNARFNGTSWVADNVARPAAFIGLNTGTSADGRIEFWNSASNNAGVGSIKMVIIGNGNVGINTTNPLTKLHVLGGDTLAGAGVGSIVAGGTNTNERVALGYNSSSGYGWIQSILIGSAYTPLSLNASGGGVGIGTALITAGAVLDVKGGGVSITQTDPAMYTPNLSFSPGSSFNTKGLVSITAEWVTGGIELGHALKVNNHIRSGVSQIGSSFAIEAACYVETDWFDSGAILAYVGSPNIAYRKSVAVWALGRGLCAPSGNTYHLFRATSECNSGNHPSVGYYVTASATDNFCVAGFQVVAADYAGFLVGGKDINTAAGADPLYPFAYNSKVYGDLRFYVDNGACVNVRGTNDTNAAMWIGRNNSATITSVIRANGAIENVTGTVAVISDRQVKTNIEPATPKLDQVLDVKMYTYNLPTVEDKLIGVMADELKAIFPSLVYNVPQDEFERVKLGELVGPILFKAFQEFVAETRARFAKIEAALGIA